MSNTQCIFCGGKSTGESDFSFLFVECPVCGRYETTIRSTVWKDKKDRVAAYLYHQNKLDAKKREDRFYYFLGKYTAFEERQKTYPFSAFLSMEEVDAFYPMTFSDRIDKILLAISKRTSYVGDTVAYSVNEMTSLLFVNRYGDDNQPLENHQIECQRSHLANYLRERKFANITYDNQSKLYLVELKPDGWQRVDELQKNISQYAKNVFVAMSFADDMKPIRESIKKAITECGYIPRIMDEIEHNHQIVPEMLYEIRQAKFVIADLTGHNNGAYFEAGYALGNGKEVIQLCRKDKFGEDGHFDVKQVNTILWEDTKDLQERLKNRIRATMK